MGMLEILLSDGSSKNTSETGNIVISTLLLVPKRKTRICEFFFRFLHFLGFDSYILSALYAGLNIILFSNFIMLIKYN